MAGLRHAALSLMLLTGFAASRAQQNGPAAPLSTNNIHRREEWFYRGRIFPGTSAAVSAVARARASAAKIAMRERPRTAQPQASPANAPSGMWVQLGPAPIISDASGAGLQDYNVVSGRATSVAIDPADPTGNTVYAGGAYGGVWKSTNAGSLSQFPGSVTWASLTDNQPTLATGSIAIQPQSTNPDSTKSVILVGTGETNGSVDSYYGLGILRSVDAGNSWTLIAQDASSPPKSFAGLGFSKIAFSSTTPALVVAAAGATSQGIIEGAENPPALNRGMYYSSDSGQSWHYSSVEDGSAVIDPSSVTDVAYNSVSQRFFAAISLHGIYSSADGITWSRLSNQPGPLNLSSCPTHTASPSLCPLYRGQLAIVPGRNEMYAWYVDANANDGGIWTTSNSGASWTPINDSGIINCGDLFGGCGAQDGTYNLALTAVPNGTATDLYAGAVNLYKCTISVLAPTCNGTGAGTFLNLTHVYGCSAIAKLHPAQHSIASLPIDNATQDVMYFANDGGIYRAQDAYVDLFTGTCGGANRFDSLNETLGSMTQLISFSESALPQNPSPDVILAGAQANGSPGTASAQNNTTWQNVNAGDGGYTAISPADDRAWFVSNPPDSVSGVNIFECGLGVDCHTEDFHNNQIVTGDAVGGDAGDFNTSFILDPQNSAEMIIGTCRIWRGSSTGGSFSLLSPNFETGGSGICSGNETNVVRSLAAGGALDANGFSSVIYAGTGGTGPLSNFLPNGGHVWVTTNAGAGIPTWADRTASINPGRFPLSSIVVDPADPSGLTAYVGIMGFGNSHVWKTNTGGVSWTDFTSNLPDAPVNALLLDFQPGQPASVIYAGTDAGVFASDSAAANWSEVGPPPGSTSGFLPNVAVTALHIFSPAAGRRLRVSTYGRGMWELSGFNLERPIPSAVTISAPGTSTPVALVLTAASFGGPVSLSCTVPPGLQCAFVGGGASLSVNVSPASPTFATLTIIATSSAPTGASIVGIHASAPGSGFTAQTQNLLVTVNNGFSFTIVNTSGSQTASPGQIAVYNLNVTPSSGFFPAPVSLTVTDCPPASTCSLSPSLILANSGTTPLVLTVATTPATAQGSYSIRLTGDMAGNSAATVVSLNVISSNGAGFSMSNSGPLTITAGAAGKFDITVTPAGPIFANAVALSFAACPAEITCALSSTQISSGSGTAGVFLTVTSIPATTPATYPITVSGTSGSVTQQTVLSLTVIDSSGAFSFTLSSPGSGTITEGGSATYDVKVTPSTTTFPNPVTLIFSGCPAVSTCSLSSSQVAAGSAAADILLLVVTTPPALRSDHAILFHALSLPFGVVLVLGGTRPARSNRRLISLAALLALAICCGCGGLQGGSAAPAGNPGTPVGVYTVTVTGTSGSQSASTTISITVQNALR